MDMEVIDVDEAEGPAKGSVRVSMDLVEAPLEQGKGDGGEEDDARRKDQRHDDDDEEEEEEEEDDDGGDDDGAASAARSGKAEQHDGDYEASPALSDDDHLEEEDEESGTDTPNRFMTFRVYLCGDDHAAQSR
jgi:hypothetical protein